MNLQEARMAFACQYLNQPYVFIDILDKQEKVKKLDYSSLYKFSQHNEAYLLLRSVSDLTDEELKQLFELLIGIDGEVEIFRYEYYIRVKYKKDRHIYFDINTDGETSLLSGVSSEYGNEIYFDFWQSQAASDWFRSKSILIPITYINEENKPITLPTERLIELGWAQVKEK